MKRLAITSDSGKLVTAEPGAQGIVVTEFGEEGGSVVIPWDLTISIGEALRHFHEQRIDSELRMLGEG